MLNKKNFELLVLFLKESSHSAHRASDKAYFKIKLSAVNLETKNYFTDGKTQQLLSSYQFMQLTVY